MPFTDAHPTLQRALTGRGYTTPTPVQEAVLAAAPDRDLLVSARTGSGKTVAFGLRLGRTLLGEAERLPPAGLPNALVIAPTRELALQVSRELSWLYAEAGARVVSCVGGMDPRREGYLLKSGAHIVVGTPGRLCDHLDRKNLDLSAATYVVLDEADEMLDMGFREELEHLLDGAANPERRTLMFSATIPEGIVSLTKRYQKDAVRISASSAEESHADIEYRAVLISPREREHAIVNLLRFLDPGSALVFCATRDGVNHLHMALSERGFTAVALSGELGQAERNRALAAVRDGRARVLVATDVAARGLDLPALDLVIHADLPFDGPTLLHRSGRTGRAGRKGTAVVLVPAPRRRIGERILRDARVEATWSPPPGADDIVAKDQERLLEELLALPEEIVEEDVVVGAKLLETRTPEQVAAMLVRMSRGQRPAPEELPETMSLTRRAIPATRAVRVAARQERQAEGGPPDIGRSTQAQGRPEAAPQARPERAPGVWFAVNIGRIENADPKWLIPLICQRGKIEKQDIGEIRIQREDTRFEVAAQVAERFEAAVRRPDRKNPDVFFRMIRG